MANVKMPPELYNELMDFFAVEISDKFVYGVTYGLVFNSQKTQATVERYRNIKRNLINADCGADDYMRIFEVCNGYIFDLSVRAAQMIALDLIKSTYKPTEKIPEKSIYMIKDLPIENRRNELRNLANKCLKELNKNTKASNVAFDIALYSRNSTNSIKYTAKLNTGEPVSFTYDAFTLKHTDLDELNRAYLIPRGCRVYNVQPCELLPTRTGVKFRLWVERLDPRMKIIK